MKRTVFYSWQSSLPSATNRNLIQDSLVRAIRALARDDTAGVEPVLDRDTANIAGAPDIAQSIFAKVAMADVFVADVSIINSGADKPCPNPNVLIELGYAIAELGWDNIILVQNGAFGGPELLPFDLRGRRIVAYTLPSDGDRPEARALLQGRLEAALRESLEVGPGSNLPSGPGAPLWWGSWHFDPIPATAGLLFIYEVGPSGFLFDLCVHNGAHVGRITAPARILSADFAYCRVSNGKGQPDGELVFRRSNGPGARSIQIDEAARCFAHGGMRAHFAGTFIRKAEPWFDYGLLNELELARLYGLVGEHIDKMRNSATNLVAGESHEPTPVRVVSGGVAGLYTHMESIVLSDDRGRMWAAFIDRDVVRYFTNVLEDRFTLPRTIEQWRVNFRDKPVKYCEPVRTVPKEFGDLELDE